MSGGSKKKSSKKNGSSLADGAGTESNSSNGNGSNNPLIRQASNHTINPRGILTGFYQKNGKRVQHTVHDGALQMPREAMGIIKAATEQFARGKKSDEDTTPKYELPGLDSVVRPCLDPKLPTMTVTELFVEKVQVPHTETLPPTMGPDGNLIPGQSVVKMIKTSRVAAKTRKIRRIPVRAAAAERIRGGGDAPNSNLNPTDGGVPVDMDIDPPAVVAPVVVAPVVAVTPAVAAPPVVAVPVVAAPPVSAPPVTAPPVTAPPVAAEVPVAATPVVAAPPVAAKPMVVAPAPVAPVTEPIPPTAPAASTEAPAPQPTATTTAVAATTITEPAPAAVPASTPAPATTPQPVVAEPAPSIAPVPASTPAAVSTTPATTTTKATPTVPPPARPTPKPTPVVATATPAPAATRAPVPAATPVVPEKPVIAAAASAAPEAPLATSTPAVKSPQMNSSAASTAKPTEPVSSAPVAPTSAPSSDAAAVTAPVTASSTTSRTTPTPTATPAAPTSAPASAPAPAVKEEAQKSPKKEEEPEAKVLASKPPPQWEQHKPAPNDETITPENQLHPLPEWFKKDAIHEIERTMLPEWFNSSSSHRTPESYLKTRCKIVEISEALSNRNVTNAMIRRSVMGDAGSLQRLRTFLVNWGIINRDGINDSAPTSAGLRPDLKRSAPRFSDTMTNDLIVAVTEQASKKRRLDEPSGSTPLAIDWEEIASHVGNGVSAEDCQQNFMTAELKEESSSTGEGQAEIPSTTTRKRDFLQTIAETADPAVLQKVFDAAMEATSGNVVEAQAVGLLGVHATQAIANARGHEIDLAVRLSKLLDARMQKLENRMAMLDDVEGILEAEKVALEMERRDLYTARCRHWFGGV